MKRLLLTLVLATFASSNAAMAAVGEWFTSDGVKLRLVSLRDAGSDKLSAGLQVVLEPGWKTYWRSPGSSGLPPQLDFSQSSNVAGTNIGFPTPIAFGDKAGLTGGYEKEVVFPIDVQMLFPERDVVLKVNGLIGVCEEICVPLQFSTQLTDKASGGSSLEAAQILAKADNALPVGPSDDMRVIAVRHTGETLNVTASVPEGTNQATLFLEGPSNWYLSAANASSVENGKAKFLVTMPARVDASQTSGKTLRATLATGGKSVEHDVTVE